MCIYICKIMNCFLNIMGISLYHYLISLHSMNELQHKLFYFLPSAVILNTFLLLYRHLVRSFCDVELSLQFALSPIKYLCFLIKSFVIQFPTLRCHRLGVMFVNLV